MPIGVVFTAFALEQQVRFTSEKRRELYEWYYSRVSQRKIVHDAKKPSESLARPESRTAGAKAVFGGGCFWCTEAMFKELQGVSSVVSGYAGGKTPNPTYEQMHDDHTGHAEVIQVSFDPKVISYRDLLELFYAAHDPTTPNQQGADVGEQYRSIILCNSLEQLDIANDVTKNFAPQLWNKPITTQIVSLDKFWPAEDYHQDFYANNPSQPYCQVVINPKVAKFRQKFASKLKV